MLTSAFGSLGRNVLFPPKRQDFLTHLLCKRGCWVGGGVRGRKKVVASPDVCFSHSWCPHVTCFGPAWEAALAALWSGPGRPWLLVFNISFFSSPWKWCIKLKIVEEVAKESILLLLKIVLMSPIIKGTQLKSQGFSGCEWWKVNWNGIVQNRNEATKSREPEGNGTQWSQRLHWRFHPWAGVLSLAASWLRPLFFCGSQVASNVPAAPEYNHIKRTSPQKASLTFLGSPFWTVESYDPLPNWWLCPRLGVHWQLRLPHMRTLGA